MSLLDDFLVQSVTSLVRNEQADIPRDLYIIALYYDSSASSTPPVTLYAYMH